MTRLPYERRWPTVLQKRLGTEYLVIAEGLNGRTTVFDDPLVPHRSGIAYLPMVLESHTPIDRVLIMLGTNDVKRYFGVSAEQSALGLRRLIMTVLASEAGREDRAPQLLIVGPVPLSSLDEQMLPYFAPEEDAISKSRAPAPAYRKVAEEGHRKLGEAPADWVLSPLS